MAARAMWKGTLRLGERALGVKLYAAVQDRDVHFKLLDRKRLQPVSQRMVRPESGEAVDYAAIRRGFGSDGSYVMLSREELQALKPEASRDIAVELVPGPKELGPEWFVRPYYLGPDGDRDRYAALAEVLFREKHTAIAHWVMRGIAYTGVLESDGECLMLITLRHRDEVISDAELPKLDGRAHSERETKMAEQLVLAYEAEFDPHAFKNEHRERVLELIEQKAKGKAPRLAPLQKKKTAPDLSEALRKSLLHAHAQARTENRPKLAKATRARTAGGRRGKEHAVA